MTTKPWWERVAEWGQLGQDIGGILTGDLATTAAEDDIVIRPFEGDTAPQRTDPPVYVGRDSRLGRTGSPDTQESRNRVSRNRVVTRSVAVDDIYGWSDAELRAFQQQMIDAGVLDPDQVRLGVRDGYTIAAWEEMVDGAVGYTAAGINKSPWDVIDEYASAPVPPGPGGPKRSPLTVELSNPEDVKRLMREAAREALGSGKLDEKRLDEIVAAWHAEQRRAQTAQYAAGESGGTVTQAPSFETFADEQARATDPTGYDSRKVISGLQHVFSMFDGGA